MKRALYFVLIFISVMVFPWYIYASLILAGLFLFNNFYEAAFWIVIIEILYGPSNVSLLDHKFLIWMAALSLVALFIKRSVTYYQ